MGVFIGSKYPRAEERRARRIVVELCMDVCGFRICGDELSGDGEYGADLWWAGMQLPRM